MKSKKFLLALALPAVFAACSNEEIVTEAPVSNAEVVGADLVSKGLTIKVGNGVESRLTTDDWESSDELGLGWVNANSKGIYQTQEETSAYKSDNKIYANHLFKKNENGDFTTYGNVYQGFHFAYYAYKYMPQVGAMTVTVNPEQTENWSKEHLNNTFHISGQYFVTANNVDVNTRELTGVEFEMAPAVSELAIKLNPDAQFAGDPILSKLQINDITLTTTTGKTPFYSEVTLNPRNLPVIVENEGKFEVELTAATLYDKAIVRGTGAKALTTEVSDEQFNLSGQQILRMYNTPVVNTAKATDLTETADASKYSFKINVSAGYFTVRYVKNAVEGSNQFENNKALTKIAELYSEAGWVNKKGETISAAEIFATEGLTLNLDASMFTADYKKIKNLTDWQYCVDVVEALGETGPVEFNVIGAVQFEAGEIPMPKDVEVKVSSSSKGALVVENDVTWPEALTMNEKAGKKLVINVAGNGVLNINSAVEATTFVNEGLINAGPSAVISTETTKTLQNKKRVVVEYGAYVYPAIDAEGTIAYVVPAVGELSAAQIQKRIGNLIATDANVGYANVNTLVVEEGVSLNLTIDGIGTSGTPGEDDPYKPVGGTAATPGADKLIAGLENVKFEINGGDVTSTLPATVKNAVINGGSLVNVDVTNGLNATDATVVAGSITGAVVAENTAITAETIIGDVTLKGESAINNAVITGNVTVEEGTTNMTNVNINGTLTTMKGAEVVLAGNDATISHIENNGELTTSVDVYTVTVRIHSGSVATVASGKTIWYTEPTEGQYGYTQEGTTHGRILYRNMTFVYNETELTSALTDPEVSTVVLGNGEYNLDIYANDRAKKSFTIIGSEGTKLKFANQQVRAELFEEFTIQNCEIEHMANKSWGMLVFSTGKANGVYNVLNCTFNGVGTQGIYINENNSTAEYNIVGCTFNGDFGDEGAITIQVNDQVKHTVNVTDCEFNNIPSTSHKICNVKDGNGILYKGWTLNTDLDPSDIYWKK